MRLVTILLASMLTAQVGVSDQWWLDDFSEARNAYNGEGVVIAVIDTGIDGNHPDLQGVVVGGADFSGAGTPDGKSPVGPSGFHGTMVASLIAGQGERTGGIIGIAPGAKLLSISIGLGIDGDTDRQLAQAVRWAVDNDADVINLSISRASATWPISWDGAFLYAMQNDVVIVAASGNRAEDKVSATAPATIPGVISVTAVDKNRRLVGDAGAEGIGVTIAASGVEMLGSYPPDEIRNWSGASAAAPLVSGLVALMRQADPAATANDIIQRLISTTFDLGEPGFDRIYGHGLVNPEQAIIATAIAANNPLGSLSKWIELYRPGTEAEQAELVIPAPLDQPELQNQIIAAVQEANPWSNPLLYLLLVPLVLLLWFSMRNRFGRDGKKKPEGTYLS
jgi:subtilisin family serine protease